MRSTVDDSQDKIGPTAVGCARGSSSNSSSESSSEEHDNGLGNEITWLQG